MLLGGRSACGPVSRAGGQDRRADSGPACDSDRGAGQPAEGEGPPADGEGPSAKPASEIRGRDREDDGAVEIHRRSTERNL